MKRCVNNLLSWGLVLTAALSAWVGPSASGAPLAFADVPFTIAVIPDTQIFSVFEGWADANFTPMTRYIAEA
ncbi:MAG: hypothetical protein AAF593_01935 [Planctomycetota bacterium]